VVLLDRGQGGRDILQEAGIHLHRSVAGDVILCALSLSKISLWSVSQRLACSGNRDALCLKQEALY